MMIDWVGNRKSTFITLGASNHTDKKREENDYYATDPVAIDLLEKNFDIPLKIWECACGEGHLSERLRQYGHEVISTDLVDRGYKNGGVKDFLTTKEMPPGYGCIITNPPYKRALDFVTHSLDILPDDGLCIMFLKTTFLEGQKRFEQLFNINPPEYILQFSKRVLCAKNGDFDKMRKGGGSAVAYAWFVFRKGYKGKDSHIRWI